MLFLSISLQVKKATNYRGGFVPMLFFAFSYHPLQQQVRFSGQRPGRKLPLAGDYPWGLGLGDLEDTTGYLTQGLGGHRGPWRDIVKL